MKKLLMTLGLMAVLVLGAGAWRPTGWVYHNHPWAYDSATGDWHWFNTSDTQWVVNMSNGQWARLPSSALATGWVYYNWAFAYAQSNGAWHWINGADRQWVVNMRTAAWSRFGVSTAPALMVLIPRGTKTGADSDFGAYSLTVSAFYMDQHEVNREYWNYVRAWAIANGYEFDNPGSGKAWNHPVHSVSWYDAVKWCNARSEMEGRPPVYWTIAGVYRAGSLNVVSQIPVAGYRLPTSDEWEYAARGTVASRRFPWGYVITHDLANYIARGDILYDGSLTLGYHPVYAVGAEPYTAPVGSFTANEYGLHDLAGNVTEWCFDWHPDYVNTRRVGRGGSWRSHATHCRVGRLSHDPPGAVLDYYGFRTVLDAGAR